MKQLNEWLQVRHVVALVDCHETNGVEGSNKQIIIVLDVLCRNWDSLDVYMFGSNKVLLPSMTLVTERLCVHLRASLQRQLLNRYTKASTVLPAPVLYRYVSHTMVLHLHV